MPVAKKVPPNTSDGRYDVLYFLRRRRVLVEIFVCSRFRLLVSLIVHRLGWSSIVSSCFIAKGEEFEAFLLVLLVSLADSGFAFKPARCWSLAGPFTQNQRPAESKLLMPSEAQSLLRLQNLRGAKAVSRLASLALIVPDTHSSRRAESSTLEVHKLRRLKLAGREWGSSAAILE